MTLPPHQAKDAVREDLRSFAVAASKLGSGWAVHADENPNFPTVAVTAPDGVVIVVDNWINGTWEFIVYKEGTEVEPSHYLADIALGTSIATVAAHMAHEYGAGRIEKMG